MTPDTKRMAKRWAPYGALVLAVIVLLALAPTVKPKQSSVLASGGQFGSGSSGSTVSAGGGTSSGDNRAPGASGGTAGGTGGPSGGTGTSGSGSSSGSSGPAGTGGGSGAGPAGGPGTGTPGAPVTPASTAGFKQTGTDCARRVLLGSQYPCEPLGTTTNNGGATYKGVTGDQVTSTVYVGGSNAAVNAVLQQANAYESPAQTQSDIDAYQKFFNTHFQSYNRRVDVVLDQGKAQLGDAPGARADAVALDTQYHTFFNYGGGDINLQDELARRGIPSVLFPTSSYPESVLEQYSPQGAGPGMYQLLPTPEQTNESIATFICRKLKPGSLARYGGVGSQGRPRIYGLVYPTEAPDAGIGNDLKGRLTQKCGINVAVVFGRTPDINSGAEQASTAETKMQQNGVTTELCLCDPVTPLFLTHAATSQSYFPEWFVTSYEGQDDDLAGQNYDQAQWVHAFGIADIPLSLPKQQTTWYKVYKAESPNTEPGIGAPLTFDFLLALHQAVEAAGPTLSPLTLQQGIFQFKATARNGYEVGFFFGPHNHGGLSDFTEVWWDPTGASVANPSGKGTYRYVDAGHRFLPDSWPGTPAAAFDTKCTGNGTCGNPAYANPNPIP